jgi:VanZ family protein
MLLPLRYPRLWLVAGWSLVVLAILASLLPVHGLPAVSANDKLAHMAAYTLLSLWFSGIYPKSRYVLIAGGLFLLGLGIEWAQGAMHYGRQADLRDMAANALGIAAGIGIALLGLGGWALRVERLVRRKRIADGG